MTGTRPRKSQAADDISVKLHVILPDKKVKNDEEVILHTSKGYEVVDVDGLVFRRKRKSSGTQSLEGIKRSKAAASSPPQAADEECALQGGAEKLHTSTQPAEPELGAASVQETAEEVVCRVEGDGAPTGPSSDTQWPVECTESLLSRLPAAASEADRLLCLCNELAKEGGVLADGSQGGPNQGMAAMLELLKEGVSAALQDRTLVCHGSDAPAGLSPAALAKERAAERLTKEKHLQERLDAYRQEEEWKSVLEQALSVLLVDNLGTIESPQATVGMPESDASSLLSLQKQAHRRLCFQVEGLSTMVASVEELVSKAERHCRLMQAEYHKEKFMIFPHMDSPARLIHEIVRPRRM